MQLNSLLHEISVSEIQEIEINLRLKEWFETNQSTNITLNNLNGIN